MQNAKLQGKIQSGSTTTKVIIVITVLVVIGMVGFILLGGSVHTSQSSSSATPAIPVKDFAPNVPMSQKTTILIQTSDSSDIKYIVPTDQVATYVKSLPQGYRVVSKTP